MRRIARLAILSLVLIVTNLVAAPHSFLPIEATQPDGSKINIYASGDEFHNWLHDENNYTIVRDDSGAYVYAIQERGSLVPSDLLVGRDSPNVRSIAPGLNLSQDEIKAKYDRWATMRDYSNARAPHTGQLNNIVIFIKFSNSPEFAATLDYYEQIFNNPTGNSMKRYFQAASYNQLTVNSTYYPAPNGNVVLSYTDTYPRSYFQPYSSSNTNGYSGDVERTDREHALLKRAVEGVRSGIPTSLNIDGDNDGYVDNVCFIIQGGPDGWSDLLWPHKWVLYTVDARINGKRVWEFNFQLETSLDNSGASVLSHEMFHSLGAPDLYRYVNDEIDPVGRWDLMATNLNPPQHMSAWMKYRYGEWINNVPTITTSGTYTLHPVASSSTNNIYRINSWKSTESYVLEYRKSDGTYDGNLPGSGLLVYRLDTRLSGNAQGPPDELYIYRPGGTNSVNGYLHLAAFSQQSGRTEISEATTPNGFLGDGSAGGLNLFDVGSAGDTISFKVKISDIQLTYPHGGEVWQSGTNKVITWKSRYTTGTVKLECSSDGGQSWNLIATGLNNTGSYTWNNVPSMNNSENVHIRVTHLSSSHTDSNYYPFKVFEGSLLTKVIIGTGTGATGTNAACPINVYYQSLHGQSVYTKAELNAAGVYGPISITGIGFNIAGLPARAMPNFTIRMGHTTSTNASSWISTGLTQVWSSASYQPTATGWNMCTLSIPFLWNGMDNIVVDTAFSPIGSDSQTGTVQYTYVSNGYRFVRMDTADQTNVFSGGYNSNNRPNLKLALMDMGTPTISIDTSAIAANLEVGTEGADSFVITNTGSQPLTFNISMAEQSSKNSRSQADRSIAGSTLTLNATDYLPGTTIDWTFTVTNGSTDNEWLRGVIITFPTGVTVNSTTNFIGGGGGPLTPNVSSGNGVTITWYAESSSGYGLIRGNQSASATVNVTIAPSFSGDLTLPWTINGDGYNLPPHTLSGSVVLTEGVFPVSWLRVHPLSGSIAAGESQVITTNFSAIGMSAGTYEALLTFYSNDLVNPSSNMNANLRVWDGPVPDIIAGTSYTASTVTGATFVSNHDLFIVPADENTPAVAELTNLDSTTAHIAGYSGGGNNVSMTFTISTAGEWYLVGYWGGGWHEATPYPLTVSAGSGTVTLSGMDFTAKGNVYIVLSPDNNPTLPVELSHFSATMTAENYVQLTWTSQTESNLLGYNVYRNYDADLSSARKISELIEGTNTSTAQTYIYVDEELEQDGTYYYWLQNVDLDGTVGFHGPASVVFSTGGGTGAPPIPLVTKLENAYPNPFNPDTTIRYQLKEPAKVEIDIYNLKGQIVRSFVQSHDAPGYYKIIWDGCDSSGRALSSGVYLYKMSAGSYRAAKKLVLKK